MIPIIMGKNNQYDLSLWNKFEQMQKKINKRQLFWY